jgi:hypothetical protein
MLMWDRENERWEWDGLKRALLAVWRFVRLRVVCGRCVSAR